MKVLIGCEFSGIVREAFRLRGHDAWSCDLLDTEIPGQHYKGDVRDLLADYWDLAIFHPPCTDLAVSGARYFKEKRADGRQQAAINFFMLLATAEIPKTATENPISIMSTIYRKPNQIIQPWMFGHGETKATCLWLKGLAYLTPTDVVGKGARHVTKSGKSLPVWYNLPPSADRWKIRSATFLGIADAMAAQWG
jgi:hypothetical protein